MMNFLQHEIQKNVINDHLSSFCGVHLSIGYSRIVWRVTYLLKLLC